MKAKRKITKSIRLRIHLDVIKLGLAILSLLFLSHQNFAQKGQYNPDYARELDKILENDQKYRNGKDPQKQVELDKQNRRTLDKLFEDYGFPTIEKVGRERLLVAIVVVHHSEDCEWNEVWVRRLLDNYEEVLNFQVLMSHMFERTYGSEQGICQSSEFINEIKQEYSLDVIGDFGIDRL